MDSVVAAAGGSTYVRNVSQAVGKLLLLFAVLLMPFGMGAAPAAAAQPSAAAGMPMQHCPDEQQSDGSSGNADCTTTCAASMPALNAIAAGSILVLGELRITAPTQRLPSVQPAIVTPPPKNS